MLHFDDEYFKSEIKCDFEIPEMMKRVWAVELTVLSEIDRICTKYNLKYFAFWGTLIGAVRHKGFVPWDDDIDIAMMREDYDKLMKVLKDELPSGFYNSSSYSDATHNQPLTSIMNTKDIIVDPKEREKFYGCPYICGIDIFPIDYVARDKEFADLVRNLYTIVYDTAQRYNEYVESGESESRIASIEELCNIKIDRAGNVRNQLWLLLDSLAKLPREDESDLVTYFPTNICYRPEFYMPKDWFTEVKRVEFENITIPVPVEFDKILRSYYGDYMTPSYTAGRAHDYPFYKNQEEWLRENI